MNSQRSIFKISNYFSEQLNSRSSVGRLAVLAKDSSDVVFDFNGIVFISRAAAHELIKLKQSAIENKTSLTFENTNKDVESMMKQVEESMLFNVKQATLVNYVRFETPMEYSRFIFSI